MAVALLLLSATVAIDTMTASDLRLELGRLMAERLDAAEAGLGSNSLYMRDLDDDLAAAREAYVGLAVTELASLRGELCGRASG